MNSRPLTDRDIYLAYREEESLCELSFELHLELGRDGAPIVWPVPISVDAADAHHIWSLGRRPDFKSNLIALSRIWHDRFHFGADAGQGPIRLLCMLSKLRKAERLGDPSELVLADLDAAAGRSVRGWVEGLTLDGGWGWAMPFRREFLERTAQNPASIKS